jgi:toxin ParE1/3/4
VGERYQVQWAEDAVRDLEAIVAYVAESSALNAGTLLAGLRAKAGSLELAPGRGRVVPELAGFGIRTWRELLLKPYRVIYRPAGHVVLVLAVLDGRRDLADVLLERLLRSGG